ncbi:MAG: methyl-accepting chemotaxis protein [Halothiobacillaceae bacterium]|nr:methyl-accepting chemotaxis protein [Halothiobacillaceae bacterium]
MHVSGMTIGRKLSLAFSLIVLVLLVAGSLAYTALSQVNANAAAANQRADEAIEQLQREMGHMAWVNSLANTLLLNEPFQGELNPAKCKFGEWLHQFAASDAYRQASPEFRRLFDAMDAPHDALHETAGRIIELLKRGDEAAARAVYREDTLRYLGQMRELFAGMRQVLDAERAQILSEAAQHARQIQGTVMFAMLVGVALAILLGVVVTRGITRPIHQAVDIANRLAQGDLRTRIHVRGVDETAQLLRAMQIMVERLTNTIREVRQSADSLTNASGEITATAQAISQSATEQAASVEETSAAAEQISASISQNADNAHRTDTISTQAAHEAQDGGVAAHQMVDAMKSIAAKISIIDEIAYQTNLLALNAAIEAARAGEHGKGFAVVATEVRKLAERSQIAAKEIGEVASSSVTLAEKAGQLLEQMVPSIQKTSELVREIASASQEQSTGASQISEAMTQLSQVTQQNASASEELAATAEEMNGQADQLQGIIAWFRTNEMDEESVLAQEKPELRKVVGLSRAVDEQEAGDAPLGEMSYARV